MWTQLKNLLTAAESSPEQPRQTKIATVVDGEGNMQKVISLGHDESSSSRLVESATQKGGVWNEVTKRSISGEGAEKEDDTEGNL